MSLFRKRLQSAISETQGKRHRMGNDGKDFITRGKAYVLHKDGFSVYEYLYEVLKQAPPRTTETLVEAEKALRDQGAARFHGSYLDIYLLCTGTPMPVQHRKNEQNALALISTARKGLGSKYLALGRAVFETEIGFQEVCVANYCRCP